MPGHVFVNQGSLSRLDCDAVIVPADYGFSVLGHWAEVLGAKVDADGLCEVVDLKPEGWSNSRYGRTRVPVGPPSALKPTGVIDARGVAAARRHEQVSDGGRRVRHVRSAGLARRIERRAAADVVRAAEELLS